MSDWNEDWMMRLPPERLRWLIEEEIRVRSSTPLPTQALSLGDFSSETYHLTRMYLAGSRYLKEIKAAERKIIEAQSHA